MDQYILYEIRHAFETAGQLLSDLPHPISILLAMLLGFVIGHFTGSK